MAAQLESHPTTIKRIIINNGVATTDDKWETVTIPAQPINLGMRIFFGASVGVIFCIPCYLGPKVWYRIAHGSPPKKQRR